MNAIREIEATSADGTVIGVQVTGSGPPLVLVHGGTADRTRWTPLLPLLGDQFTVITFDRRGRGASANEAPAYAIEREGEDLLAVLATAGEPALVFAHSYGATVTLTVLDRLPATAVLLYEPPFDTEHFQISPDEQLERWIALLDQGEREAVLESFYRETLALDTNRWTDFASCRSGRHASRQSTRSCVRCRRCELSGRRCFDRPCRCGFSSARRRHRNSRRRHDKRPQHSKAASSSRWMGKATPRSTPNPT